MKTMKQNGLVWGCLLSATLFFSCTKAEEADNQNQIEDKKPSVWTDEELKPREGEVTEDGQPVVMAFGATVDYTQPQPQKTEDAEPQSQEEDEIDYGALEEQQALSGKEETKSHLGTLVIDGDEKYYPNLWSVGDCVNINGESTNTLQEGNITNEGKRARFPMAKWVEKYGDSYYVGYPYSAFDFSEGTATVTLPATQSYVSGTYDPAAFIMLGKSAEEALVFYPKVAPFRITIPGTYSSTIKKVRLESVNGEPMSGTFSTDYNNASATFTAVSPNDYVEMNTPNIAFGSTVFFVLPAKTYARGIRIRVTTADNKEMVFSNTKSITISVGSMTALTSPNYAPTVAQTTPTLAEITPSSFYVQWASGQSANDYAKRWEIRVYTNSECSGDPLRTINIYPKPDCWPTSTTPLRFVVGRMDPGATYYVKVKDVGNDNENSTPASITLSSAPNPVTMPASNIAETGIVLHEDFSEIGWSSSYYNDIEACGFYPTASRGANNISQRPFTHLTTTDNSTFHANADLYGFSYDRVNTAYENSRLAQWLYSGYNYFRPGYIKMGIENKRGYLFTPAIPLASGKSAIVKVTVKAAKYNDNSSDTWALAVVNGVVPAGDTDHNKRLASSYTWPSTTDASLYRTLTFDSKEWTEQTVEGLYMTNGDRLIFGLPDGAAFTSEQARLNLAAVTIEVTELTDDMIIRDATSLDAFKGAIATAVAASESTDDITGRVVADFSAASIASSWTPIDGYTGTLEGNDHTISGLTKPFFGDLEGTVKNLTLNSTLNYTTDTGTLDGLGIFAQYLNGTMSDCVSKGSVTFQPSAAITNATRHIGGMVGCVDSGSMTRCTNQATVSFPHNSQTNDMIINVGGTVGTIDSSTACSYVHNEGTLSVGVINSTSTSRVGRIGGVVGYVTNSATGISNFTNSGALNFTGTVHGALYIGGVVGYTKQAVTSCQNSAVITSAGSMDDSSNSNKVYRMTGGIAGYVDANVAMTSNVNTSTGTVAYSGSSSGYSLVGGIVGYSNGVISGGSNSAAVSYTGSASNSVCLAGIVGRTPTAKTGTRIDNVTNNGNITLNTAVSHSGIRVFMGGVSAHQQSGDILAHNTGSLTVTRMTCTGLTLGGIVAETYGAIKSGSDNAATGDISVGGLSSGSTTYVAGLAGYVHDGGDVQGSNAGDVTLVSGSSISNNPLYVAGLVGYMSGTGNAILSSFNTGAISNAATTTSSKDISIGGLAGFSACAITSSYNDGTVTNSGASGADVCLGGVVGNGRGITLKDCHNLKAVSNSGGGNSLFIGGLTGYSNGCTYDTSGANVCYNTGAVSNSGTGTSGNFDLSGESAVYPCVSMGGLIGAAVGANDLDGSSSKYNYNNGSVSESSASTHVAISGICGCCDNLSTDFSYVRNNADGDISISSGSYAQLHVGGVLGTGVSATVDYTRNAGNITFSGVTIDEDGQLCTTPRPRPSNTATTQARLRRPGIPGAAPRI